MVFGELYNANVKNVNKKTTTYDVILSTEEYPDAKKCWSIAKKKYTEDRGISSWGI